MYAVTCIRSSSKGTYNNTTYHSSIIANGLNHECWRQLKFISNELIYYIRILTSFFNKLNKKSQLSFVLISIRFYHVGSEATFVCICWFTDLFAEKLWRRENNKPLYFIYSCRQKISYQFRNVFLFTFLKSWNGGCGNQQI